MKRRKKIELFGTWGESLRIERTDHLTPPLMCGCMRGTVCDCVCVCGSLQINKIRLLYF